MNYRLFQFLLLLLVVSCGNSIELPSELLPEEKGGSSDSTSSPVNYSFQAGNRIGFPKSFGVQNFPTGVAQTANGDLFISAITSDTPGWERWLVFKSTDNGSNFSVSDQFIPHEEGEGHPLSMTTNGSDVFVCGYFWESGQWSEWIIRKTSNGGSSWSTVDTYAEPNTVVWCQDIAAGAGGRVFAVGWTQAGIVKTGVIRWSNDNGNSWSTIFTTSDVDQFVAVDVSPSGVVWAL